MLQRPINFDDYYCISALIGFRHHNSERYTGWVFSSVERLVFSSTSYSK